MAGFATLIPAAQYLRRSTDQQEYSLQNQAAALEQYALANGFVITTTYEDSGRSGLRLRRRAGLQQLLSDVVSGRASYRAILVYDVSRWGRFQDIDEAAHYEFICKEARIPIHYCAEPFLNDGNLPNMIMKSLKRLMAGEYSRELSSRVCAGARRLAQLGFKQGGVPGFGLRRALVSPERLFKQELLAGQRKSIQEDRVILAPGPAYECYWVREMFRMFIEEEKWPVAIARRLNEEGVRYQGAVRKEWYAGAVNRLLKNPKYAGYSVYGRVTRKLHMPQRTIPKHLWIVKKGAWEPIIEPHVFEQVQERFAGQTVFKSNDQLIDQLRGLLRERGTLSERLVLAQKGFPAQGAYRNRFGTVSRAFALAGFDGARTKNAETRRRYKALRDQLIDSIVRGSCSTVSVLRADGHFKPRLRFPDGVVVTIYICPCIPDERGELRWVINPKVAERGMVALVARLAPGNQHFQDFYLLPALSDRTRWTMKMADLKQVSGIPLYDLSGVVELVGGLPKRQ